jgi:hypothetical protein
VIFLDELLAKKGIIEALEYIGSKGFSEVISTKENTKISSEDIAKLINFNIIEVTVNDKTVLFNISDEGRRILKLFNNK